MATFYRREQAVAILKREKVTNRMEGAARVPGNTHLRICVRDGCHVSLFRTAFGPRGGHKCQVRSV